MFQLQAHLLPGPWAISKVTKGLNSCRAEGLQTQDWKGELPISRQSRPPVGYELSITSGKQAEAECWTEALRTLKFPDLAGRRAQEAAYVQYRCTHSATLCSSQGPWQVRGRKPVL